MNFDMKINKYLKILLVTGILASAGWTQGWNVISEMPRPVHGAQALVLDSMIYIFGGYSDSAGGPVDWIQVYNPANGQWTQAGAMSMPRYGFVADRLNDSAVVFCGGIWADSLHDPGLEIWKFRRQIPDWDNAVEPDINFDRVYMTGHVYKNSLFLFGGLIAPAWSDTTHLYFIIRYDIYADVVNSTKGNYYRNITPLPYHHMSVRIGSTVYLIGGVNNFLSDKIQKYDLELDTLEQAGNMRRVCAGGQAVTDSTNIYIIGGYNEQAQAQNRLEIFNPNTNTSYSGPLMNHARKECMAVVYQNSIYVFGGKDQYTDVPAVEKIEIGALTSSDRVASQSYSTHIFALYDNYPNPFNSATMISFYLSDETYLTIDIYSITGRHVRNLARGQFPHGLHRLSWDGTDQQHNEVASNVYICRLRSNGFVQSKKMVLIR